MRSAWATTLRCLAVALLGAATLAPARAQDAATPADPQYLTFQIFTGGPGMTTQEGKHVFSRLPDPGYIEGEAKSIDETIGARGDARRRLGIMVGPLVLDYTDAQMRELIARTFAIAAQRKIAVGFHIDDSKFWLNRADLWRDPANVEWLDWKGTPNTGQYLNWGQEWKIAPQACLNSPAMIKEARRITRQVIGPAIAEGIALLRKTGDEGLFAGVIVGWETAIGRDFATRGELGYCALTNLGFSAKSPPPDIDAALESVVQGWIETWSIGLGDAGVPADKIYSHIAFSPKTRFDGAHAADGPSYSRSVLHTPAHVAFGQTHLPGFSTYPQPDIFEEIYQSLQAEGAPHWASAEGTNVDIQSGPPSIPAEGMEDYLARMFNHGATLANVFGWNIGEGDNVFRQATQSQGPIEAYRKFLSGGRLDEKPLAQSYRSDASLLQKLVHALPGRIEAYLKAGGRTSVIQPKVAELEALIKQGKVAQIQRQIELVEALIDAQIASASKRGFDIAALQRAVRAMPQKISEFQQRHGDLNRIKARVDALQRHLDAGELEQAFEEVEALEPILDSP